MIGIDFDNTIVCYDAVIHAAAVAHGLIPTALPPCKGAVRNYLRRHEQEEAWIELQGYVYGRGMREAVPFPGATEFFVSCARRGVPVCIVSHRTRHPFRGPRYDLHHAAHEWLDLYGFYDSQRIGLPRDRVFFEVTKEEKIARIHELGCSHFVDDLPELLQDPTFPSRIERILFDPNGVHSPEAQLRRATSWDEITTLLA